MEQGNAIQLSVVLFLPAYNRCANGCTAADEQQGSPQCKVACIAGLRQVGGANEHWKDDVVGRQLLRAVRVGKELAAALARAAVVFDIAVLLVGRLLARHKRQGMLRGNR